MVLMCFPAEHVGTPSVYVSHCWDACFLTMVEALEVDFASRYVCLGREPAHLGYAIPPAAHGCQNVYRLLKAC